MDNNADAPNGNNDARRSPKRHVQLIGNQKYFASLSWLSVFGIAGSTFSVCVCAVAEARVRVTASACLYELQHGYT